MGYNHYWVVCLTAFKDGIIGGGKYKINSYLKNEKYFCSRGMIRDLVEELKEKGYSRISVDSVSYLGKMTEEEFEE
ncbi:MAG: hypothetical protein JHC31_11775 [Sulfurihydrogenibium sp.]|jgi:hypothetical protein|nr:hypothetical protein [Sulfurihydrogenibium sp.]